MKTNSRLLFVLFIIVLTFYSFTNKKNNTNSDKFVVVLDAGHGGKDPGRPTKFDTEKEIALRIVLAVGKELEKNPSIKVIYTRKTDVFVTLRGRAKIANEADADLFVSIHCNAHNTQAYGTETYVLGVGNTKRNFEIAKQENEVIFLEEDYEKHYEGFDPNSPESTIGLTLMQEEYVDQSILLAGLIENNFVTKLKRKSRGVKQISLWVLHNTYMPSVLIETGFITNKSEGAYLSSNKGQNEMANAIKDAILNYKNNLDQNVGEIVYDDINQEDSVSVVEPDIIYPDISFKVQIAASSKRLATKPYNFRGLNDISREKVDKLFKYFYGETSNYNEIKQKKEEAIIKGYNSSFIVAYKNGEKIPLTEALKTTAN